MELKKLKELVQGSQMFSVKFVKRGDGKVRVMNCNPNFRTLEIKGTGQPVLNRLLTRDNRVYQQNLRAGMDQKTATAKSMRSFYAEDILMLKAHGKVYDSEGKEVNEDR